MEFQVSTPIVFIIFNRPDTTRKVFEEIRRVRPSRLLVVADGPRVGRVGEVEKCEATRAIIEGVDWPCMVLKNFSDINLGCKLRMSSGIDWAFDQVEEAIILEDDCLPHITFFQFCQEMLEYYRHDLRIAQISGCNFHFGFQRNEDSYYFSKYNHIWGWASWRDRWKDCYDVNMLNWPRVRDEGWSLDMFGSRREATRWTNIFNAVYNGEIDTWDYQWTFACWLHGRLTVLPNYNLISNIGFGSEATHTKSNNPFANIPIVQMKFPVINPLGMVRNQMMDTRVFNTVFSLPFLTEVMSNIRFIIKKMKQKYRSNFV